MQPTNLADAATQLSTQLATLATDIADEVANPPKGFTAISAAKARRDALTQRMVEIQKNTVQFQGALTDLRLPDIGIMTWARALLNFPSAAILEIDTTGIDLGAEVIRVVLLSMTGDVLLDRLMRGPSGQSNPEHTGITPDALATATPIAEAWSEVIAALQPHYLVALAVDFDLRHLAYQSDQLHATPHHLMSEDVVDRFGRYFGMNGYYVKLEDCARQIGHPMPDKPERNALDRARATLAVLHAIADGWQKPPTDAPSGEDFPF